MRYYTNHCWCSDSIFGGVFECRYIVTVENKDSSDEADWDSLVSKVYYFSHELYESNLRYKAALNKLGKDISDEEIKSISYRESTYLKDEVLVWLNTNIKDSGSGEGWCIGTPEYNSSCRSALNIFFYRRSDAMKFIKEFSKYKKPTVYFDYFKSKKRELNLLTLKLED